MTSSPPVFELLGVSHRFDGHFALEAIDWRVERGQHWALLGPNGAGKTTLLRIIAGYLWPNHGGQVYRDGQTLVDLRELRKSIGWVNSALVARIPAREPAIKTVVSGKFAQIGLVEFQGMHVEQEDYERASWYLKQLDADDIARQSFGTLSQGQQQKVLICRARMARPLLIILDDPCVGLDPGARETLLGSLQQLAWTAGSPSLVLVTHHIEEIMPAFSHTLAIDGGQVVACGNTADLLTEELLTDLYGVSMQVDQRDGRFWPVPRSTPPPKVSP